MSKQSCDLTLVKVEGEVFDCLNMLTPAPQSRCVPLWGREEGEMAGKGGRREERKIRVKGGKGEDQEGGSGVCTLVRCCMVMPWERCAGSSSHTATCSAAAGVWGRGPGRRGEA